MTATAYDAALENVPTRTTASLTVVPVSPEQAGRAKMPASLWAVSDVWSYITEEMTRIHGPQLPGEDSRTVVKAFCERFGIGDAVRIARTAFEVYGGMWRGAPITIKRFTAGHDDFFACPVLAAASGS